MNKSSKILDAFFYISWNTCSGIHELCVVDRESAKELFNQIICNQIANETEVGTLKHKLQTMILDQNQTSSKTTIADKSFQEIKNVFFMSKEQQSPTDIKLFEVDEGEKVKSISSTILSLVDKSKPVPVEDLTQLIQGLNGFPGGSAPPKPLAQPITANSK